MSTPNVTYCIQQGFLVNLLLPISDSNGACQDERNVHGCSQLRCAGCGHFVRDYGNSKPKRILDTQERALLFREHRLAEMVEPIHPADHRRLYGCACHWESISVTESCLDLQLDSNPLVPFEWYCNGHSSE